MRLQTNAVTTAVMSVGMSAVMSAVMSAQSPALEQRIAAARSEAVSFYFTARPGVCGDGEHYVRTGRSSYHGSFSSKREMEPCISGPVQVRLTLDDGAVIGVRSWVGPLRSRAAQDLGAVPATEAARYLMSIAARGAPATSAKAIFPAVLADSAVVWPQLLAIAKDDDSRSKNTRREAMFWLSRYVSGAVMGRPNDPLFDDDENATEDESVKTNAVFVLSQLRNGEGIPDLLQIARSNPNPRVRSAALFWLGQSGDPRVLPLFESLLPKR